MTKKRNTMYIYKLIHIYGTTNISKSKCHVECKTTCIARVSNLKYLQT